ncbi:hypothetical protein SAMN05192561_10314 [Halopenitus malekzadehii]|uniref:Uncharacterized protein n=1 Tax=Halopenitus malekzadehii TaxID=1267564 RepID=A0A1H6IQR7_9EURY|nr:hypothetical protein [Halopenitus malekzadehii]SEH48976.1 hypothetical protein SAMN05192561_10314 [Halopenitus malekzadehii]
MFTNDEDFYVVGGDHGLLVYDQVTDPTPSAVVAAIERIDAAYESDAEILETVPGGWL